MELDDHERAHVLAMIAARHLSAPPHYRNKFSSPGFNGLLRRRHPWFPLACQFLRLFNLRVGHLLCGSLSTLCCIFVTVSGRQFEPLEGLYNILRNALAIGVRDSEIVLSSAEALVRSQP